QKCREVEHTLAHGESLPESRGPGCSARACFDLTLSGGSILTAFALIALAASRKIAPVCSEVLMDRSKQAVAQRLAEAHYEIEPGIELIVQLLASPEREADPTEPIKLLEVNQDTTGDGIRPVFFWGTSREGGLLLFDHRRGDA